MTARPKRMLRRTPLVPAVLLALAGIVAFGVSGCEDSVRNTAVNHPVLNPASPSVPVFSESLPLDRKDLRQPLLALMPPAAAPEASGARAAAQVAPAAQRPDRLTAEAETDPEVDGSADSDQKSEPAAIDEIAASAPSPDEETVTPLDPHLRNRAEGELKEVSHDLPLTVNDEVLAFVDYFQTTRGRAIVETGLRRAGKYRPMIEGVFRDQGMPTDLMYLAQAESAFQPQALSKAGARGLWQFMAFRGKQYGLDHNWWVDDRQDPEKATRAAAAHLRDLYQMFGDWYLVMAAYNSGPLTVQRAVERTGYADFWELYKHNALPKETRNYVPIILALTLIAKDPARYGIQVAPDSPVAVDSVQPGHPVDLRLVAETIDADLDTLRSLNPELLHVVTPTDPEFVLHLPQGTAETFQARMADIPADKWVSWQRHRVEAGETLASISRKYHVGTSAIADANSLGTDLSVDAGTDLIIPVNASSLSAGPAGTPLRYRVRSSDTLETIADEFDVTVPELKKWNGVRATRISRGVQLKIYPNELAPSPSPSPSRTEEARAGSPTYISASPARGRIKPPVADATLSHRVKPGETLYSIARTYMTSVEALRSANQFLFSRPLQAGDLLTLARQ
jgi:membrane-bound lytic murein transglycosylase D